MAQKLKNAFQPTHQLVKEPIVVNVDLMNELVEVVLMACAEVDEGLYCLVGICRDLLSLAGFDSLDSVIDKHGEVCNAVVDVRGLVDANKRLVEYSEEIAEKLESGGLKVLVPYLWWKDFHAYLLDDLQHHELVALSQAQLEILLEMRKELGALSQVLVDLTRCISTDTIHAARAVVSAVTTGRPHIFDGIVPCDVGVENLLHLLGTQLRLEEVRSQDRHDDINLFTFRLLSKNILNPFV